MYVNCKSFETRFLLFRTCRVEDLNLIVLAYKNSPLSSSPIKSEPVEYKGYTQRSIEDMTRILGQTNLFRYILCLETFHIRDKNGLTRIVNILFKISTSSQNIKQIKKLSFIGRWFRICVLFGTGAETMKSKSNQSFIRCNSIIDCVDTGYGSCGRV